MKQVTWLVVVASGISVGCSGLPRRPAPAAAAPPPAPTATKPSSPQVPVSAEQITETNARQKAEALRQELDREALLPPP
ncbi:MAG: hypothetical protein NZ700_11755 [Gemmataceae bacterium]|nr:hypothetical protein [Gemmataceae bacterium]MDW8266839.1 hypothetical protein [Gemmataceae bacterium]